MQHLAKLRAARQLFEAAPVLGAGRLLDRLFELCLDGGEVKFFALGRTDVSSGRGSSACPIRS